MRPQQSRPRTESLSRSSRRQPRLCRTKRPLTRRSQIRHRRLPSIASSQFHVLSSLFSPCWVSQLSIPAVVIPPPCMCDKRRCTLWCNPKRCNRVLVRRRLPIHQSIFPRVAAAAEVRRASRSPLPVHRRNRRVDALCARLQQIDDSPRKRLALCEPIPFKARNLLPPDRLESFCGE